MFPWGKIVDITSTKTKDDSRDDACTVCFNITGFTFKGDLTFKIWVRQSKQTPKLEAHERGHAKLCKRLWEALGPGVARDAANTCGLLGLHCDTQMVPPHRNVPAACALAEANARGIVETKIQECTEKIIAALIKMLKDASDDYDRETDHGRNQVPTNGAVGRAFARAEQAFRKPK